MLTKLLKTCLLVILLSAQTYALDNSYPTQNFQNLKPQYVAVQDGQLEYYRFGHGSPIVLIMGYAADVTGWNRDFLAALAVQHDVIVFNNRNVGKSIIHSSRYESEDLAQDTYQLIKQLNLKKPAVLGISMGGMIAQQVAASYPNALGELILINTAIAGKQSVHPTSEVKDLMFNMPTSQLGRYWLALQLFFPPSTRIQMSWSLIWDRFLPQEYSEIDPAAIMPAQQQLMIQWGADDATAQKLARLKLPVLILNGGADQVIPPVNSEILAKTIPHAQLKRWLGGGHLMIYQYPQALAEAINQFIAEQQLARTN